MLTRLATRGPGAGHLQKFSHFRAEFSIHCLRCCWGSTDGGPPWVLRYIGSCSGYVGHEGSSTLHHRVPLGKERGDAGVAGPGVAHSPQEAECVANASADAAGQCRQVGGALEGGTRLCASEAADGRGRAPDRARPGVGGDRAGKPRLQYAGPWLAQRPRRASIGTWGQTAEAAPP